MKGFPNLISGFDIHFTVHVEATFCHSINGVIILTTYGISLCSQLFALNRVAIIFILSIF